MTTSLPADIQQVFAAFLTTEYTTLDGYGQPITWPVTPFYSAGDPCIDVTTGLGLPKKADDARANPRVALLFSDPTGSGLESAPMVLVQGSAQIDDSDLEANRRRYAREAALKLPAARSSAPPAFLARFFDWYYTRIYVHVRPERVYAWAAGDTSAEPEVYASHLEEVRAGHSQEGERPPAEPEGGAPTWGDRVDELGRRYRNAVLSWLAPDGFPFAVRVPVTVDARRRRIRIASTLAGLPLSSGLACLTAHDHAPDFAWARNFQIRGDLLADEEGWSVVPHRLVEGLELAPTSTLERYRMNLRKIMHFRATASRELARRRAERSVR